MEAFLICAATIVLGEIGDRTQLLALILTTQLRRPLPIILGILVATLANHALAALLGQWAGSLLSPRVLRWTLGVSFLLLAAWVLVPDKADSGAPARSGYGAFMLTVTTFFLAEMLVEVPTVLLAGRVMRTLPLRWIRLGAALAYSVLGALTLLGFAPLGF